MSNDAFIYDAIRTPRGKGKPGGGLYEVKPIDLVANLLEAMKSRHELDTTQVEDFVCATGEPVKEQGGNLPTPQDQLATLEEGRIQAAKQKEELENEAIKGFEAYVEEHPNNDRHSPAIMTKLSAIYAARGIVFGVLAAFLSVFAIGLLLVGLQRGIQALWEIGFDTPQAVYLSYFTLGGILSLIGMFLFWKRNRAAS